MAPLVTLRMTPCATGPIMNIVEIAELKFETERAHQKANAVLCRVCGEPAVVHFAHSEFCGCCFWRVSRDLFGRGGWGETSDMDHV